MYQEEGSISFLSVAKQKLLILQSLVNAGFNVIYMDSDIVLFKDPVYDLLQYPESFVFQMDRQECTGFFLTRPRKDAEETINCALNYIDSHRVHDQYSMVYCLKYLNVTRRELNRHLYSNGAVFFAHHNYPWDPIDNDQVLVHNNFIRGEANKEYRFLEIGFIHRNYSEDFLATARYITMEHGSQNSQELEQQLIKLVDWGNRLNRTVVVPPIRCSSMRGGFCTICNMAGPHCFTHILTKAVMGYRISVVVH